MPAEAETPLDIRALTQKELLILIDGKLNVIISKQDEHTSQLQDHETRLRQQEHKGYITWRQFWVGVGAVGTLASALASALTQIHLV